MRTVDRDKSTETQSPRSAAPDSLLVGPNDAAKLLSISRTSWDRLVAAGNTPRPLSIFKWPRWSRETLQLWVSLGCPNRKVFEAITKTR